MRRYREAPCSYKTYAGGNAVRGNNMGTNISNRYDRWHSSGKVTQRGVGPTAPEGQVPDGEKTRGGFQFDSIDLMEFDTTSIDGR